MPIFTEESKEFNLVRLQGTPAAGDILVWDPMLNSFTNGVAADVNNPFNFPNEDGTAGQVLATTGSGTLYWTSVSGGSSDRLINGQAQLTLSSSGILGFTNDSYIQPNAGSLNVAAHGGISILTDAMHDWTTKTWTFGDDGRLTLPVIGDPLVGLIASPASIMLDANGKQWSFDIDGNITLPENGDIKNSSGTSVLGGGGNANTGDFVFSGNIMSTTEGMELKLDSGALDIVNGTAHWQFKDTGDFTTPNGGTLGSWGMGWPALQATGYLTIGSKSPNDALPGAVANIDLYATGEVSQEGAISFTVSNTELNYSQQWLMTIDGNLTIPTDGDIVDGSGRSVLGRAQRRTIIYPTGQAGDQAGTIAVTPSGDTYVCTQDYSESTEYPAVTGEQYATGQSLYQWTEFVISGPENPDIYQVLQDNGLHAEHWQVTVDYNGLSGTFPVIAIGSSFITEQNSHYNDVSYWFSIGTQITPFSIPTGTSFTLTYTGVLADIWRKIDNERPVNISPLTPELIEGNLWWNVEDGRLYVCQGDYWIDASPSVPQELGEVDRILFDNGNYIEGGVASIYGAGSMSATTTQTVDIRLTQYQLTNTRSGLRIYPTVNESNHVHLTSIDPNEYLILGSDRNYIYAQDNINSVVIGTNGGEFGGNAFVFDSNGALSLPTYGVITKNSYNSPNLLAATWADTNWAFGFESNNNYFYTQAKFFGANSAERGFRIYDTHSGNAWTFTGQNKLVLPPGGDIVNSNGVTVLGGGGGSSDRLTNNSYNLILGSDGKLTAPGEIWAKAGDSFNGITFSTDGSSVYTTIKVDDGANFVLNNYQNIYFKRSSADRLSITDSAITLKSQDGTKTLAFKENGTLQVSGRLQTLQSLDFMYGGYPYMGLVLENSGNKLSIKSNVSSGDYNNTALSIDRITNIVTIPGSLDLTTINSINYPQTGQRVVSSAPSYGFGGVNACFSAGDFTVGSLGDVQVGWTVKDSQNTTYTVTQIGIYGYGWITLDQPWYVNSTSWTFTSPDYQTSSYSDINVASSANLGLRASDQIQIGVGSVLNTWTFGTDGTLVTPNGLKLDLYQTISTGGQSSIKLIPNYSGSSYIIVPPDNSGDALSISHTGSVVITASASSSPKQWDFNSDGTLTFPDGSVQAAAYAKKTSNFNTTSNEVTADSIKVGINGSGIPYVKMVSGSADLSWTSTFSRWNGSSAYVLTSGGSTGITVYTSATTLSMSGFTTNGDSCVATFMNHSNGQIHRVTYLAGPSSASTGGGSVIVERLK